MFKVGDRWYNVWRSGSEDNGNQIPERKFGCRTFNGKSGLFLVRTKVNLLYFNSNSYNHNAQCDEKSGCFYYNYIAFKEIYLK